MAGFTAENYLFSQATGISEAILAKPSLRSRPRPVPLWQRNQLSFFMTAEANPRIVELTTPLTSDPSLDFRPVRERVHSETVNATRLDTNAHETGWTINPARDERSESFNTQSAPENNRQHSKMDTDRSGSCKITPLQSEPKSPADMAKTDPTPVLSFKEHQDILFRSLSLLALKTRPLQTNENMILSGSHALVRMPGINGIRNSHVLSSRNRSTPTDGFFDDDSSESDTSQEQITGFTVPFSFQASCGYRAETWLPAGARMGLYKQVEPALSGDRCNYLM